MNSKYYAVMVDYWLEKEREIHAELATMDENAARRYAENFTLSDFPANSRECTLTLLTIDFPGMTEEEMKRGISSGRLLDFAVGMYNYDEYSFIEYFIEPEYF